MITKGTKQQMTWILNMPNYIYNNLCALKQHESEYVISRSLKVN